MVIDNVLRVKHLPKELSNEEKEEFLQHFGATEVKIVNYPKEKVIAFAKFENAEVAKAVLFRLHQLVVLNSRLSVDYAEHDIGDKQPKLKKVEDDSLQKKCFKNFIVKLHSFNNSAGFHQPPPPHLRYEYPKANRPTINNIAHVLATVPKFYMQVLHLMNRMNLPPPFVLETVSTPPLKPHLNVIPQKQIPLTPVTQNSKSSSESEIESDNESNTKDIIPQKHNISQKRPIKRPKFIKPNAKQVVPSKIIKNEEVFDKVNILSQRHIELKVSSESLERLENVENDTIVEEHIMGKEVSKEKIGTVIGDEDLKSNQIPLKDLGVFPIFKDYHPGIPSNRLYIKNIAKNVKIEDLEHIFNRYKIEPSESKPTQFDIRLMQEGRMKGQAFVTLDSTQTAQKAVEETNGFILKDKPLVVMFARSSKS
ncbi:hypothetical protein WA026_013274 [Henosepilachna vigintioctopunctata]|uniref:RNA-binding region-containing protein 3 n=1 Tax=Henosepilachna vigintioctopunctata TaxID=420089 RepID=A0AAW1UIL6_9CUCU